MAQGSLPTFNLSCRYLSRVAELDKGASILESWYYFGNFNGHRIWDGPLDQANRIQDPRRRVVEFLEQFGQVAIGLPWSPEYRADLQREQICLETRDCQTLLTGCGVL